MAENQRPAKQVISGLRTSFMNALQTSRIAFGDHAFRRYVPDKDQWRRPILAALYDAHMFTAMNYTPDEVRRFRSALDADYLLLFSDVSFRRSIDAATNTPTLFRDRIRRMRALFVKHIGH
jgi:hypothetical protein